MRLDKPLLGMQRDPSYCSWLLAIVMNYRNVKNGPGSEKDSSFLVKACTAKRVKGETVSVWDRSVNAGVFHVCRLELAELKESENAERENKLVPDPD